MPNLSQDYQRSGLFVPTTNVWEVESNEKIDPNVKLLLVRLYQTVNTIALALNLKEGGYYVEDPFVTGALLFPNPNDPNVSKGSPPYRQMFRAVINFGALPTSGTTSVAHNLTIGAQWTFTRIYGCSTNPTLFTVPPTAFGSPPLGKNYIPLPYVSVRDATGNLELSVDQVNVNITTAGTDYSNWTITYIILEWVAQ